MNKNSNISSCTWGAYSCGTSFSLLIIKSCSGKLRLLKCLTFKLHKHYCTAIAWNQQPECYYSHLPPLLGSQIMSSEKPRGGTKQEKSVNNSGSAMLSVSISKVTKESKQRAKQIVAMATESTLLLSLFRSLGSLRVTDFCQGL